MLLFHLLFQDENSNTIIINLFLEGTVVYLNVLDEDEETAVNFVSHILKPVLEFFDGVARRKVILWGEIPKGALPQIGETLKDFKVSYRFNQ